MKLNELKNGAVVETRNGDKYLKVDNTFLDLEYLGKFMSSDEYNDDLLCIRDSAWDIIKVNNDVKNNRGYINKAIYNAVKVNIWTWERPESILDKTEKDYLKQICKPYDVLCVVKEKGLNNHSEYICICIKSEYLSNKSETIDLPYFKKGTMYKGMDLDKEYTVEELGIK